MDRWKDRVALITGASGGIGAATAKKLAGFGMKVVICARNFEKLQEVANELKKEFPATVHPIRCDVTKEDEILAMFEQVNTKYGGVDVILNNAGLSHYSSLATGKSEDWRNMLDSHTRRNNKVMMHFAKGYYTAEYPKVNVLAPAICAREAIASMKKKGVDDGHIININSLSGHRVLPTGFLHFYSMTKYALKAMTEGLRFELREMKSHIRVSQISPGMVKSEFINRIFTASDQPVPPQLNLQEMDQFMVMESKNIADLVVILLSTPPQVEIHDILVRPTSGQF